MLARRCAPASTAVFLAIASCDRDVPRGLPVGEAAGGLDSSVGGTTGSGPADDAGSSSGPVARPGDATDDATDGSTSSPGAGDDGPADESFSFLVYGDSRAGNGCEGNAAHLGLVARMLEEPDWEFVVHLGDMTTGYDASTCFAHAGDCVDPAAHGNFAEQIAPLLQRPAPPGLPSAFVPVVGNHDDNVEWTPDACGDRLCDVIDLAAFIDHPTPNAAPCGADFPGHAFYSFRRGGVLFVVLRVNSDYFDLFECNGVPDGYQDCADYCAHAPSSPQRSDLCYNVFQYDWLRGVLDAADDDPTVRHRVVLMHAPLYTSYDDHGATTSFGALVPLFEAHDVDLVFAGHNHTYERTVPIRGGVEAQDGIVYVTTGHGGSEGGAPLGAWFTAAASGEYHYMRIDVTGDSVHGRALDRDGNVLDTF